MQVSRSLTHSSVSLCNTTTHSTQETSNTWSNSRRPRDLVNLCSSEQQDGSLCRCLDPSPWNKTLVKSQHTTARPDRLERLTHRLSTVRGHLCLDDFQGLTERRHFEPVTENQRQLQLITISQLAVWSLPRGTHMFITPPTAMLDHENPPCCGAILCV